MINADTKENIRTWQKKENIKLENLKKKIIEKKKNMCVKEWRQNTAREIDRDLLLRRWGRKISIISAPIWISRDSFGNKEPVTKMGKVFLFYVSALDGEEWVALVAV